MGFKVTFSDRFQKSYMKLSETERKQVKNKIRLLCEKSNASVSAYKFEEVIIYP